jgi:hypothetical protein
VSALASGATSASIATMMANPIRIIFRRIFRLIFMGNFIPLSSSIF